MPIMSKSKLYDLRRWRNGRLRHLKANPLCVACQSIGKVTAASVVDHRTPHKGSEELFFDESNWQSMCIQHHNEKTAAEDGGFGNKRLSPGEARKPQQGCNASGFPLSKLHHWNK